MYLKIIFCVGMVVWSMRLPAQDASQTMLEQIAALRTYIGAVEKGTQVVGDGLHAIRDIRNDEFHLHAAYFASLSSVNPVIKNSPVVSEMVQLLAGVVNAFGTAMGRWGASPWFQGEDMAVAKGYFGMVETIGVAELQRLQGLVSDSTYQLTDGERIRGIESIAQEVASLGAWVARFIRETDGLILLRQRTNHELEVARQWMGLSWP